MESLCEPLIKQEIETGIGYLDLQACFAIQMIMADLPQALAL